MNLLRPRNDPWNAVVRALHHCLCRHNMMMGTFNEIRWIETVKKLGEDPAVLMLTIKWLNEHANDSGVPECHSATTFAKQYRTYRALLSGVDEVIEKIHRRMKSIISTTMDDEELRTIIQGTYIGYRTWKLNLPKWRDEDHPLRVYMPNAQQYTEDWLERGCKAVWHIRHPVFVQAIREWSQYYTGNATQFDSVLKDK